MRRDETGPAEVSLQEPHHGYEGEIGGLGSSQNRSLLAWKPKGRTAAPEGLLCLPIDALASFQPSHNKVFTVRTSIMSCSPTPCIPFSTSARTTYLSIYLSVYLGLSIYLPLWTWRMHLNPLWLCSLREKKKKKKKRPFLRPCISRRLAFTTSWSTTTLREVSPEASVEGQVRLTFPCIDRPSVPQIRRFCPSPPEGRQQLTTV